MQLDKDEDIAKFNEYLNKELNEHDFNKKNVKIIENYIAKYRPWDKNLEKRQKSYRYNQMVVDWKIKMLEGFKG